MKRFIVKNFFVSLSFFMPLFFSFTLILHIYYVFVSECAYKSMITTVFRDSRIVCFLNLRLNCKEWILYKHLHWFSQKQKIRHEIHITVPYLI